MNTSITTWMLAGALAASLLWNAKGLLAGEGQGVGALAPAICAAAIDLDRLDLSAEQRSALENWSKTACAPACDVSGEAQTKWDELSRALRDPTVNAERLRALSAEVSSARQRSLDSCVASILEVRRVLSPQQLGELMQCCGTNCSMP